MNFYITKSTYGLFLIGIILLISQLNRGVICQDIEGLTITKTILKKQPQFSIENFSLISRLCDYDGQERNQNLPIEFNSWQHGENLFLRGSYDEAKVILSHSLVKMNGYEQMVRLDGLLLLQLQLEKTGKDISDFSQKFASEHHHNSAYGYSELGRFYMDKYNSTGGDTYWRDKAESVFILATKTNSMLLFPRIRRAEAYYWLGRLALSNRKPEEAKSFFLEAVKNDPKDQGQGITWMSLMYLVDISITRKDWGSAFDYLKLASELEYLPYDRSSWTIIKMADVYLAKGEISRAIITVQDLIESKPNFYPAHLKLAQLYIVEDKFIDAKKQLRIVLELDPNNSDAKAMLEKLGEE